MQCSFDPRPCTVASTKAVETFFDHVQSRPSTTTYSRDLLRPRSATTTFSWSLLRPCSATTTCSYDHVQLKPSTTTQYSWWIVLRMNSTRSYSTRNTVFGTQSYSTRNKPKPNGTTETVTNANSNATQMSIIRHKIHDLQPWFNNLPLDEYIDITSKSWDEFRKKRGICEKKPQRCKAKNVGKHRSNKNSLSTQFLLPFFSPFDYVLIKNFREKEQE